MKKGMIQYTIRQVSERVDMVLRDKALKESKSINQAALDALSRGLGVADEDVRHHDLDDLAGTWVHDADVDKALVGMDRIDSDLWK